jgi:hypothetical protein
MTTIIVNPAKENSRTRRYRQRGELMAKRREDAEMARKINRAFIRLSTGCSDRAIKAMSLPSLREKREQEATQTLSRNKTTPTVYGRISAVGRQKMKLGEKPLIK